MENKKLVLKICCSEWKNASHDKRELSVCKELGADVIVVAKGNINDKGRKDKVDGFDVRRCSTRPLGTRIPNFVNRVISIFTWANYVRKINASIISGHDLSGLSIGWISNWFKKKDTRALLIYDSHEFEIGRNSNRGMLKIKLIKYWERFLIKKCVFSIMVNDSIADEVQRIHNLKERPIVVRNIPDEWIIDEEICKSTRRMMIEELFKCKVQTILIYHGVICNGRGIEDLIKVVSKFSDYGLMVLGNANSDYYKDVLVSLACEYNVNDRVYFHKAVDANQLWKYIGAADYSMVNISPITKSYFYALPNKFFEALQSETPIIASDLPEMKRLVEKYNIGVICKADDVDALYSAFLSLPVNGKEYNEIKQNIKIAKKELCWKNEKKVLERKYKEIICE